MDKNVCPECKTENEPEYSYCKNCGYPLYKEQENGGRYTRQQNDYGYGNARNNPQPMLDSIDGIPSEEISAFIGIKAPSYLQKFTKMQLTNSKLSWCWPVVILSFLFGPLGAAIWFFYRKMYKWAFLLSAIGFVTMLITALLGGGTEKLKGIEQTDLYSALNDTEFLKSFSKYDFANFLNNAVDLITAVLTGLFAVNIYKNHIVLKIHEYRIKNSDPRYYRIGLSVIGGNSGGMAFLGVVLMCVSAVGVTAISNFISSL